MKTVKGIKACGGTDLFAALKEAIKMLKNRVFINDITSIFFLTDGRDNRKENFKINLLEKHLKNESLGRFQLGRHNFSINCFGYGEDHDAKHLSEIANLSDGCFYYIENHGSMKKSFLDSLGGLVSIIGDRVQINISVEHDKKSFQSIFFGKTYGNAWGVPKEDESCSTELGLIYLIGGVKKDFVFKLNLIPKVPFAEGEFVVSANLKFRSLFGSREIITKSSTITIRAAQDENIFKAPVKALKNDVTREKLRVEVAEAIECAIDEADKKSFEKGAQIIKEAMMKINDFESDEDDEEDYYTITKLKKTLEKCQEVAQKGKYNPNSRNQMTEIQALHMNQCSSVNHDGYTNQIQALYQKI